VRVFLSKYEGVVFAEKVAKHARKDTTVSSVVLARRMGCTRDKFPLVYFGKRTALLGLVFILEVAKEGFEVPIAASTQAVVNLNALELHENDSADPVQVVNIDCKEDLVELENITAYERKL